MQLFIPTYQRYDPKLADTLRRWPQGLPVSVVVQPQEARQYHQLLDTLGLNTSLVILPRAVKGIAMTREYIRQKADHRFCMIDDDLGFLARNRPDHPIYLGQATDEDIQNMFGAMEDVMRMGGYAHVAISMREGNNRVEKDYQDVGRGIRVVAYDRDVLDRYHLHFRPEVEGREDLDMTLQLLRRGYPNRIFYRWAQGQRSSNSPGGLSDARTAGNLRASAERLAELHPGLVKVVEKSTTTSWAGIQTRADVIVRWQKAYGLRDHLTKELP